MAGMERRSRRMAALLVLLVVALAAAACGGSDDEGGDSTAPAASGTGGGGEAVAEPTEPTEVTFASWIGNEARMKNLAKKFHADHPNITIKFQNVPAEQMSQKLTAQIAGGTVPDSAMVDAGTNADFASRGALVNLDEYVDRSDVVKPDDYVEAFKVPAVYEDSLYGLPFDGESTGLFYRTDLFKAAGITEPPKTWDEFAAAAKKLTDKSKKQYGYIVFAPESAYYWYPFLWQAGGETMSEDGKEILFNNEAGKKAAEFYINLAKYSPPDFLNSNSYDGRVAFAQGKVAMYMAGAWFAGVIATEYPKLNGKWATAPLPEGEAGCKTTIAGDNLVLFDGSKKQDAAWLWIEYLSRPENIALWTYKAKNSTLLPPLTSQLDSPELVKEKPILKGFAEAMKCGVASKVSEPRWPKIEEELNKQLGKAMYGDVTAAEAVDAAAEKGQKILDRG